MRYKGGGSSVGSCHLDGFLLNSLEYTLCIWLFCEHMMHSKYDLQLKAISGRTRSHPDGLDVYVTSRAWRWCPLTHSLPGCGSSALGSWARLPCIPHPHLLERCGYLFELQVYTGLRLPRWRWRGGFALA